MVVRGTGCERSGAATATTAADPQWARSGRELFLLTAIAGGGSLELMSAPVASADGSRFLTFRNAEQSRSLSPERAGENPYDLRVVPRWAETIQGAKDSG